MAVTTRTMVARNEYTSSVDSMVNAFVIGNNEEIIRPVTELSGSWTKVRIFAKVCISGSAPTGNLTGVQMFIGLCAKDREFSKLAGSDGHFCTGYYVGAYGSSTIATDTLTAQTNANTIPATINIGYAPTAFSMATFVTGTIVQGGGGGGLPRHETLFTSSFNSSSYMGYAWQPLMIEIIRTATGVTSRGTFCGWAADATAACINVPNGVYHKGMYLDTSLDTTNVTAVWSLYLRDCKVGSYLYNHYISSQNLARVLNETTFGVLDHFNVFWRCNQAGVNLCIRDIAIQKLI